MNEIVIQVCNKCLEEKDARLFAPTRLVCRACKTIADTIYANANIERTKQNKLRWVERNRHSAKFKENAKSRTLNWQMLNPDLVRHYKKVNYSRHKAEINSKAYFASTGVAKKDIPPSLLAAKIEHLKIIHLIKEIENEEC